jgi:hypothetical protein
MLGGVRVDELAEAGRYGHGALVLVLGRGEQESAVCPLDLDPYPVGALLEVVEVEAEQFTLPQAEGRAEVGHELVAGGQAIADAAELGGLPREDEAFGSAPRCAGRRACGGLVCGGLAGGVVVVVPSVERPHHAPASLA